MGAFRERLASDIVNVFLNLEHFGEEHYIDDAPEPTVCVLDEPMTQSFDNGAQFGLSGRHCVLFARQGDIPQRGEGESLAIDGSLYRVVDWRIDEGMSQITLDRAETRGRPLL